MLRIFFYIKTYLIHLVLLQLFTGISSSKSVSVFKSGETLPKEVKVTKYTDQPEQKYLNNRAQSPFQALHYSQD